MTPCLIPLLKNGIFVSRTEVRTDPCRVSIPVLARELNNIALYKFSDSEGARKLMRRN